MPTLKLTKGIRKVIIAAFFMLEGRLNIFNRDIKGF